MKNSFICLILLITFSPGGKTQSLLLEYNGQLLTNQSVIVRSGTPDSLDLTTWLKITNLSSDTVMVTAKKDEISQIPGASASICWAGYCYPSDVNESLYALQLSPGESATGCFAHFTQQGTIGESTIRWTYFISDNPDDSVCVTINYYLWPEGIENQFKNTGHFSLPYPNPASRQINIRRDGTVDGDITLSVFDPAGRIVSKTFFPSGVSVFSIYTGNLPSGNYYYSLNLGAQTVTRGNFIIVQ
jgi:hypothetical protein